jgi:hypothetical protein
MFEYKGVIHIHSTYSDGSGSVTDIVKAASEVDVDFILLTDHNTLQAQTDGCEGWHDELMLIVGYELNDKDDKNHYLVFGLNELPENYDNAKTYVDFVEKKNGIGFIAHPLEKRKNLKQHPAYPWTDWDINNYTGIEIWNHMSEWVEGLTENNKVNRLIHPLKSINAPSRDTLKLWDRVNRVRPVPAIGSVDAHAYKQDLGGFFNLEIFAYKILFKSIRTHVLLDDDLGVKKRHKFEKQKKEILNALKNGHSFVANYYHGDAKGFRFSAQVKKKKFIMGDTICKEKNDVVNLSVQVPLGGEIRLLKNGEIIQEENGMELLYNTRDFGNYRVEVYKGKKGWIYSNNIRIIL